MKTKLFILVLIVIGLIALNGYFPFKDYLQVGVEWSQRQGPWGAFFIFLLFVICVVGFIPIAGLIMMSGTLYGLGYGYLLVASAGMTSIILTYALGKRLWRDRVERLRHRNPRYEAVFEAIAKHGALLVFLIRLNPLLPYSLLNYLFTIPKLNYRSYLLSSLLGMTPDILLYLYIGRMGQAWLDDSQGLNIWNWLILGTAMLTSGAAAFIIRNLIKKAVASVNA